MPMSIEELERSYRRAYRRLSIGIGIAYATFVLAGVAAVMGNARIAGWISAAVQAEAVSRDVPSAPEPIELAQPARRIRTVKND